MHTNNNLISVITPNYNSGSYVKETIRSLLNQTYENWEMIIVDDCSTDDSLSYINTLIKNDVRFKLILNDENLGPGRSRNKGIKEAKGQFICFLDSDDLWKPNKLELQLNFMLDHNYDFTYTRFESIDEFGNLLSKSRNLPHRVNYTDTIKSNKIGCLTVMYRREKFKNIFMEDIPRRQDLSLWLKFLKSTEYAYCLDLNLSSYRIRPGSISSKKFRLVLDHWNLYKNIEKHSVYYSIYYVSYYIFSKLQEYYYNLRLK